MAIDLKLVSNPIKTDDEAQLNPGEEKIQKLKHEQEARRASLFSEMEEYREIYHSQEKKCAEAQSVFLMAQRAMKGIDKNDSKYAERESEYLSAKKIYNSERFDKDLKLSLLQYRSDNYVKASRLNIVDLA